MVPMCAEYNAAALCDMGSPPKKRWLGMIPADGFDGMLSADSIEIAFHYRGCSRDFISANTNPSSK